MMNEGNERQGIEEREENRRERKIGKGIIKRMKEKGGSVLREEMKRELKELVTALSVRGGGIELRCREAGRQARKA